jgi:enoyl-CoA hydratase
VAQLITSKQGAVGTIVLSNPAKYNAMSFEMWKGLPQAIDAFDRDPEVRVIVLEGEGEKAFVSGSDISRFESERTGPEATERYNAAVEHAHLASGRCGKPVIAKIRGICIGGGVGLAASCDVRLCADDARFRIPAARIGIGYPAAGLGRLLPLMGPQNVMDILFSARYFNAAEALRMGLVAHVFPAAEFTAKADEWISLVAQNAPLTLRAVKLATHDMLERPGAPPTAAVTAAITACFASNDYKEGTRAFGEKRTPVFEGR